MAKEKQDAKSQNDPKNLAAGGKTNPNKQGKGNVIGGIIYGILALLVALVIMVGVFGGAFYFVVKNNVNGIADRYKKQLLSNSVTSWMLPAPKDPYDPSTFTDDQLKSKYNLLRQQNKALQDQLNTANQKLKELDSAKADAANSKSKINTAISKAKSIETAALKKEEELKALQKKLNEMVASGDKSGFKQYFESVDPATAKKIYTQIMKEQKVSEDTAKFVGLYEAMDTSAVVTIFEGMGTGKINMVAEILKNMKKSKTTEIIATMSPTYAAKITERLTTVYGLKTPAK